MAFINRHSTYVNVTANDPSTTNASSLKSNGFIDGKLETNKNCSTCKCSKQQIIWIEDFQVPPTSRKQGKGRELFNVLKDWAKKNNIDKICGRIVHHPNGPSEIELKEIYKRLDCSIQGSNACYEITYDGTLYDITGVHTTNTLEVHLSQENYRKLSQATSGAKITIDVYAYQGNNGNSTNIFIQNEYEQLFIDGFSMVDVKLIQAHSKPTTNSLGNAGNLYLKNTKITIEGVLE